MGKKERKRGKTGREKENEREREGEKGIVKERM